MTGASFEALHFFTVENVRWRALCRAVKSSRLHAGYRFAASLLFRIVRASTHPFKICPKSGFAHHREPERTLLDRREAY